ncbi:MAG: helix-turn-helix domain-containing protein [Ardenticatenaceae bacterium]|nr:helix-turn-helix domain-containing protein [Ardenticatenaceae bacterium]
MMVKLDHPTAREVWRLALPLGTSVAGGTSGLARDVFWARTSSHLSTLFPGLEAGELALLDLQLARDLNPTLTLPRIIRALARVGIAALAVATIPDEPSIATAEEFALPLFQLPPGTDLARVARSVIRLITDREAQEEARAAELYHQLTQRVAAGTGLEGVLGLLARVSGHSAVLLEPGGEIRLSQVLAPFPPTEALTGLAAGWAAHEAPVLVNGRLVARLRLIDRLSSLDRLSELAVEQGAAALALELAKQEAVTQAQQALQGDLLDAVLAGESEEAIRARARGLGYPLDGLQWAIVAATLGEAEAADVANWARRAQGLAEARGWRALVTVREQHATILIAASTIVNTASWLTELRGIWTHSHSPLTLGAGEPMSGLSGLKAALGQAQDALALGLRLFGPGGIHRHADLGFYRLLRHLQGQPDLESFYQQTLAPLVAYDEEHGGELVTTLEALLATGGNVSRTAQALHLHRNSLIYRLDRIQQITGLNPTDPEDAFTLKLALLLAPLRQK